MAETIVQPTAATPAYQAKGVTRTALWLAQKTKSTWAGFIFHGIGNGIILFVLIPGILA